MEDDVRAGDGIDGEVTMPAEPVVCVLFLRLKNDLNVLPGEGESTAEGLGEPTRLATCFLLLRVQVRR